MSSSSKSLFLILRRYLGSSRFREEDLVRKWGGGKWGLDISSFALSFNFCFGSFIFSHWTFRNLTCFFLGKPEETSVSQLWFWWGSKPNFLLSLHFPIFQPHAHHLQPLLLHLAALWRLQSAALHFLSSISVWRSSHNRPHWLCPGPPPSPWSSCSRERQVTEGRGPYTSSYTIETLFFVRLSSLCWTMCCVHFSPWISNT